MAPKSASDAQFGRKRIDGRVETSSIADAIFTLTQQPARVAIRSAEPSILRNGNIGMLSDPPTNSTRTESWALRRVILLAVRRRSTCDGRRPAKPTSFLRSASTRASTPAKLHQRSPPLSMTTSLTKKQPHSHSPTSKLRFLFVMAHFPRAIREYIALWQTLGSSNLQGQKCTRLSSKCQL